MSRHQMTEPRELFLHELGDVLYAEQTLVKALPKLVDEAFDPELAAGFEAHLEEIYGVKVGRERGTTVMTVTDCVEMGIEAAAPRALDVAWDGADAVWLSFDVDCLDATFVPGTGWPEPGGFLPREVLKFIQLISDAAPLAGMEVVECSPPYDNAEITALISTRVICDTLGCLVRSGHMPKR